MACTSPQRVTPRLAALALCMTALLCAAGARAQTQTQTAATATAPPALDVTGLSKSVGACTDFYMYANEQWLLNTKIPGDRSTGDVQSA